MKRTALIAIALCAVFIAAGGATVVSAVEHGTGRHGPPEPITGKSDIRHYTMMFEGPNFNQRPVGVLQLNLDTGRYRGDATLNFPDTSGSTKYYLYLELLPPKSFVPYMSMGFGAGTQIGYGPKQPQGYEGIMRWDGTLSPETVWFVKRYDWYTAQGYTVLCIVTPYKH